jgi:hypothetical protein
MSPKKLGVGAVPARHQQDSSFPLPTLLSQTLVAFTIEFDNEFERRMSESGCTGARLSLVVWSNLIRFFADGGVSVRHLATQALATEERIKSELGCLERWGFVVLRPDPPDDRAVALGPPRDAHGARRDGWGSGRGIRANWIVRLTFLGIRAAEIWPPLFEEIERRWRTRFGDDQISRLRGSLQTLVGKLGIELPQGLPAARQLAESLPARTTPATTHLPLSALLSQPLLAFAVEFDRTSPASIALCANAIRVLSDKPVRVEEIPRLTGGSPEASGVGWELKQYVVVEPDLTGRRGKVARLTPLGLKTQQTYRRLIEEIEDHWKTKFGEDDIRDIRESLQSLFSQRDGDRPAMSAGLVPPPGVVRAGTQAPALGRRNVAAAARQRMRDLVAQTEAFVGDPAGTLPHYPLWDMNRGFGP